MSARIWTARTKTPNMDRFASEAVVFDKAYAGSFPTLPCRRDLFTGRWGHPFNTWDEMERDIPTLAARLRAEGNITGLVFDTPNTTPRPHVNRMFS